MTFAAGAGERTRDLHTSLRHGVCQQVCAQDASSRDRDYLSCLEEGQLAREVYSQFIIYGNVLFLTVSNCSKVSWFTSCVL